MGRAVGGVSGFHEGEGCSASGAEGGAVRKLQTANIVCVSGGLGDAVSWSSSHLPGPGCEGRTDSCCPGNGVKERRLLPWGWLHSGRFSKQREWVLDHSQWEWEQRRPCL